MAPNSSVENVEAAQRKSADDALNLMQKTQQQQQHKETKQAEKAREGDEDGSTSSYTSASSSAGSATPASASASKSVSTFVEGDDTPMIDFRNASEWANFISGAITLVLVGPPIGLVVFTSMIWEAIDRGFDGGFVDSGKELTGFIFTKFIPWLENKTHAFNNQFVKRPEDAYMINCIFAYGVLVPGMFFACAWHVHHYGLSVWVAFAYHLLRIGPYFMNFAYVYTLAHKEGHAFVGPFTGRCNQSFILRNVVNWWIGMFYGVLPAVFTYGHSVNHHRYSNGPLDVVTNADKPRDNFFNWVAYVPRFLLYNVNISTVIQFVNEGKWKTALKVVYGSAYFFAWMGIWVWALGPGFAMVYVAFPFFEAGILLAAVNWSWHAFFDPSEPDNEFVQSITILDGTINVLNEDSHVVHHQYPGAHWTEHPKHLDKFWEQYVDRRGSVFRKTHAFEIFGMSVARDYDALAHKFADLKGEKTGNMLTHQEKVVLIKKRLRGCWWGPRAQNKNAFLATGEKTQKTD
mmetsp:Transcript_7733/g.20900  ORF Transcript_7733/g.20900 Transcript_7733/m.20900 type:complete len:517 (-) Transcript_7733:216-1766(-)|eukprot:CAMPEP_0198115590 /NCGR_PEP_ID=MMETSP1442-20131203/6643_1 /TAXON_ID= /ORGANISM="Craspedostauros australis, Strain CCMP3328" /LENGTH=516 /DNA_ID=CAMNT_0043773127 /DNA_START=181 /DNA_END=1731 /DNA_ORIENTATION=-